MGSLRFLAFVGLLFFVVSISGIKISKAVRLIDIQGEFLTLQTNYTFKNDAEDPMTTVQLLFDFPQEKIAFLRMESLKKEITYSFDPKSGIYTIPLSKPVPAGKSQKIVLFAVLTHVLTFLPEEIAQAEPQNCVFEINPYIRSLYVVEDQFTSIRTRTKSVISEKCDADPASFFADREEYRLGTYQNIAPSTSGSARVHFECNYPFLTATKYIQDIRISHWGSIYYEEHVEVKHTGANLKGFFSRLNHMKQPYSSPSAIFGIRTLLPHFAREIYYRDEIGNISSSHVNVTAAGTELDLIPRFPLFGGWRIPFYFGYQLPLARHLVKNGGVRISRRPSLLSAVVDNFEQRIALPEGARNIRIVSGYDGPVERTKTYGLLEWFGRPTLIIRAKNVVSAAPLPPVVIEYSYFPLLRFLKMIIVVLYLVLLVGAYYLLKLVLPFISLRHSPASPAPEAKPTASPAPVVPTPSPATHEHTE